MTLHVGFVLFLVHQNDKQPVRLVFIVPIKCQDKIQTHK